MMFDEAALIRKAMARWSHYVLLGRWKRAARIQRLIERLRQLQTLAQRRSA